jgi:DNA-directed RNA polymerase specialized sigma24 family protein
MGTRGALPAEGASITSTTSVGIAERAEDLHEGFARDRRRYERLVYGRLRGAICWQDAEDIVSDALIRALAAVDARVRRRHMGVLARALGVAVRVRSRDRRARTFGAPEINVGPFRSWSPRCSVATSAAR